MEHFDFVIDEDSKIKRYFQLYSLIADKISNGFYTEGEKLPSVRVVSEDLNVSKNTVMRSYSELEKKGFIYSKNKKGYFVGKRISPKESKSKARGDGIPTVDSVVKQYKSALKKQEGDYMEDNENLEDIAYFEKYILESYKAVLTSHKRKFLHEKSSPFGDLDLRTAISEFIYNFHHINANPENIIVGSGSEMLLWQVLQLKSMNEPYVKNEGAGLLRLASQATEGALGSVKPFAAVAEDTAQSTKQIFLDANIPVREVPVDDQGISFDFLLTSGTTIVYVTPGDIPLGAFEDNDERRKEILEWAEKVSYRHIIEFDTLTSKDVTCLYKTEDINDKVIYINSFSNLLCPGINAAFLILPPDIMEDYRHHYANFDCSLSYLDQLALTEFIKSGHLEAYLDSIESL